MALTQIQIIQSLGEAMNWLESELSWGVAIQEPRHLIGRIGELYAALMTGGQMAPEVNQAGYDVVSSDASESTAKPILRTIAKELGVSILNSNGNAMNTRSLGARIIKELSP
jgi:hypothetical protein